MDEELMEDSSKMVVESVLRVEEETSNSINELSMEDCDEGEEDEGDNGEEKQKEDNGEEDVEEKDDEEDVEVKDDEEDVEEKDEENDNEDEESEDSDESSDSQKSVKEEPYESVSKKSIIKKANDMKEKLVVSGQFERLNEFMDIRLTECGWKADIQKILRAEMKKNHGLSLEKLYEVAKVTGKRLIPEDVENDILEKIQECYQTNLPNTAAPPSDVSDDSLTS